MKQRICGKRKMLTFLPVIVLLQMLPAMNLRHGQKSILDE